MKTPSEWSREEEKLAQRGAHLSHTYQRISETINRELHKAQPVRCPEGVRTHLKYTTKPRPIACYVLFFKERQSTAQIAAKLGWHESDIYNAMARAAGTV